MQWVKIRSWHAVSLPSDRVGRTRTFCGRRTGDMSNYATLVDILPYTEKSCESCLKIIGRLQDKEE